MDSVIGDEGGSRYDGGRLALADRGKSGIGTAVAAFGDFLFTGFGEEEGEAMADFA